MIDVKINTTSAKNKLTVVAKSADRAAPNFFKYLVVEFGQLIRKIMDSVGSYGGRKWQVLSKNTAAAPYRKAKGGSRTANILNPSGARGFLGTFKKLSETKNSLRFGSDKRVNGYQLSAIHQYGAVINRPAIVAPKGRYLKFFSSKLGKMIFRKSVKAATINIPARPHVYVPDADKKRFKNVWAAYVKQGFKNG